MDVMACNHMAAAYYFTSSINTEHKLNAYPCADYQSFDHGLCTSCSVNGVPCQRLGYGASPKRVLGSLYLSTLSGLSTNNFGKICTTAVQRKDDHRFRPANYRETCLGRGQ